MRNIQEEQGRLIILAERGGTISEITSFLSDLEKAYIALYTFHRLWLPDGLLSRPSSRLWPEFGYPHAIIGHTVYTPLTADQIPPDARISLERVKIESPDGWEFLANLKPLQHIREYLNDRQESRKDREYREPLERTRLELENEMIRQQIEEKENAILRERIAILRDTGFNENDIQLIAWMCFGHSLSRLGRHQDANLISKAE